MSLRILYVEDHALIRESVTAYLHSLNPTFEITGVSSLREARETAKGPWDLILLDLELSDSRGLKGLEGLKNDFPTTPILVVSGQSNSSTVLQALKHGASGFVPKTMVSNTLKHALNAILDGEKFVPATIMTNGDDAHERYLNASKDCDPVSNDSSLLARLSNDEIEFVRLLVGGKTNVEIASQLHLSENQVKARFRAIYRKAGVTRRVDLVRMAMDVLRATDSTKFAG